MWTCYNFWFSHQYFSIGVFSPRQCEINVTESIFALFFGFPGVICFWLLQRWSNICSHIVRPFVCFYYNKSILNDYSHCRVNVFMCKAGRLWARGPSLSMCQMSLPQHLRVFTEVGAHWNKLVVDLWGRRLRWIWFIGIEWQERNKNHVTSGLCFPKMTFLWVWSVCKGMRNPECVWLYGALSVWLCF